MDEKTREALEKLIHDLTLRAEYWIGECFKALGECNDERAAFCRGFADGYANAVLFILDLHEESK